MTQESHLPTTIAIGCDHIGLSLKEDIIAYLAEQGIACRDFGTYSRERTHYPLFAQDVARAVLSGEADRGILICGTGVGMSIAANKIAGIRAVVCSDTYSAEFSRRHNDTNVLCFGSLVVGAGLAYRIVDAWLAASYEGGRHACRVDMLTQLESGADLEKEKNE